MHPAMQQVINDNAVSKRYEEVSVSVLAPTCIATTMLNWRFSVHCSVLSGKPQNIRQFHPRSPTSCYVYTPFRGCQTFSDVSFPLMSHLHDPLRDDWQLLLADLTGRQWCNTATSRRQDWCQVVFHLFLVLCYCRPLPYRFNFKEWSCQQNAQCNESWGLCFLKTE